MTIIMAVAAVSPIVAQLIPGRFIPQTVLLLVAGAALGPYGLGIIEVNDAVKLLSELGMAFLFLLAGYEIDPKRLAGHQGKVGLVTWIITLGLAGLVVTLLRGSTRRHTPDGAGRHHRYRTAAGAGCHAYDEIATGDADPLILGGHKFTKPLHSRIKPLRSEPHQDGIRTQGTQIVTVAPLPHHRNNL